jgi:hypothetical protein
VQSGQRILREDAETAELGGELECARRFDRTLPLRVPFRQRSARREAREIGAQPIGQRQMRRDLAQRRKLETVEVDRAARGRRPARLSHRQREVGRLHRLPAGSRERELTQIELALALGIAPADAARERGKRELGKIAAHRRPNVGEREIGDDVARLARVELEPHPQRALAARDRERQRQPFAPRGDVGVVEPRVETTRDVSPPRARIAVPFTAQIDRRGELRRRRSGQPDPVMAEAAFEAKLNRVEHELRGVAQIVVPREQRAANLDVRLTQQPFGEARVVRRLVRVELEAGDMEHTGAVAPHGEPRPLDRELLQPKLEKRQRRPRDGQLDLRELEQRRRARAHPIEHAEVVQHELRIPAVPAGRELAQFHGLAQLAGKLSGERVAIRLDLRKRDVAYGEQQHREDGETRNQQRHDCACDAAYKWPRGGDTGGRGLRGRHNGRRLSRIVAVWVQGQRAPWYAQGLSPQAWISTPRSRSVATPRRRSARIRPIARGSSLRSTRRSRGEATRHRSKRSFARAMRLSSRARFARCAGARCCTRSPAISLGGRRCRKSSMR